MRAILCMLLLWQMCCPIQLVCQISLRRSADRHASPSTCPVQAVCRISRHCFSDRHACSSACPVRLVCCISLSCSSDRHAHPSACPVRSVCRISLRRSPDWRSCHLHVLAVDLCLFSFSWDFDTAFATAVMAAALVIAMIQTCPDTNWKLLVAKKVLPKDFAMMILWCEYFYDAKHWHESLCVDVYQVKE